MLLTATCLALASIAAPSTAEAQGPVRRGLRASAGLTPERPAQARPGVRLSDADAARDARWRFQQHNGDWWYWAPDNAWMYQRDGQWNRYSENTYTPNPQYQSQYSAEYQGPATSEMVFIDSGGRAVICQSGHVVFSDGTALRTVPRTQINAQGFFIGQTNVQTQFSPGQPIPSQANVTGVGQAQFQQDAAVRQSQGQAAVGATGQVNGQGQGQAPPAASGQNQGQPGQSTGQPSTSAPSSPPQNPTPPSGASGSATPTPAPDATTRSADAQNQ
jgi:hypothetical protein